MFCVVNFFRALQVCYCYFNYLSVSAREIRAGLSILDSATFSFLSAQYVDPNVSDLTQ